MIVLYVVQFIVIPMIFPQYYPRSNNAYCIYMITFCIICICGIFITNKKIINWLMADAFYVILIIMYSNNGAYGIGLKGISLDGLQSSFSQSVLYIDVCILFVVLFVLQLLIMGIVKIVRK